MFLLLIRSCRSAKVDIRVATFGSSRSGFMLAAVDGPTRGHWTRGKKRWGIYVDWFKAKRGPADDRPPIPMQGRKSSTFRIVDDGDRMWMLFVLSGRATRTHEDTRSGDRP